MKKNPVSVILVGIGGMGYHYVKALLEDFPEGAVQLVAAVDPFPEGSAIYSELKNRDIPVYHDLENCFAEEERADLTVISSPIQHHVSQSCIALEHGSHVLCEKPVSAAVQDVDKLIRIKDLSKLHVRVGYQWSFSPAIQDLKQDIHAGRFGGPIRMRCLCLWPRKLSYFKRNDWAGRIKDKEGRWVLDSPANNAAALYLHNMFYCLGAGIDTSAEPSSIKVEVYRAYHIENYDSIACRINTSTGVELLFYASHAVQHSFGPVFVFEFDDAVIKYDGMGQKILAIHKNGSQKIYGDPDIQPFRKLRQAVRAVQKKTPILCGPEAARSQTVCINGIQESVKEVGVFPDEEIHKNNQGQYWIRDLAETFHQCYSKGMLPSEQGKNWGGKGLYVKLDGYSFFPGGKFSEGSNS
ncbi:MAG: Gfo/Idh/MocA family oxidoreductase [Candidatus Aminicenantes bacterium]|nr:Gfo/Idh/MocA family oxidoreductase [Candidatus Aminicenantes bacterium]